MIEVVAAVEVVEVVVVEVVEGMEVVKVVNVWRFKPNINFLTFLYVGNKFTRIGVCHLVYHILKQ